MTTTTVEKQPLKNSTIVRPKNQQAIIKSVQILSKLNPKLAADIGLKIFTTPLNKRERNHLLPKGVIEKAITVNGHRINLYKYGSSTKKILLVHGWEGAASDFSHFFEPLKQEGFEVNAIDLPGHGTAPRSSLDAKQAADIIKTLEVKFGPFFAIIGHSFGGFSSALASSIHPEIAQVPLITIGSPNKIKNIMKSFSQVLGYSPLQEQYMLTKLEKKFSIKSSEFQFAQFIKDRPAPSLIVHDIHDKQVPIRTIDELKKWHLHTDFLITENLGHNRILRDKKVITQILEFINDKASSRVQFENSVKYGII